MMNRRQFVIAMCSGAAAGMAGLTAVLRRRESGVEGVSGEDRLGGLEVVRRSGWALGTQVTLTALHADRKAATKALDAAFAEIGQVEQVMSLYRSDSQLCELNRSGALRDPHPSLLHVLRAAEELSAATDGAFDVTVQPLWSLYSDASDAGRRPDDAALATALKKIGWKRVHLGEQQVRLDDETAVTLNGIAQGYAADAVQRILRAHGIEHALIDTGEISTMGGKTSTEDWQIGIKHPRSRHDLLGRAALHGRCLATSGDYETCFSPDFRDHHLLDPRTGRSPVELSAVTVAASTAMEADALSTAVFLLGAERGRALIASRPGADALFVDKDGRMTRTSGFPRMI